MKASEVYTQEVKDRLIADYVAVSTPMERDLVMQKYVDELGTSIPSVRYQLIAANVYVAKTKPKKEGVAGMTKEELANAIRIFAQVGAKQLPSLTKMTKPDLETLLEALKQIALLFEVKKTEIN